MFRTISLIVSLLLVFEVHPYAADPDFLWNADDLTLVFPTPSVDSGGSVPIGNGENAANVWVEESTGDLMLLLARTDCFNGFGHLIKPGRIRISFQPESPFKDGAFQLQTLDMANGLLRVRGSDNAELLVFVDANRPVYVVQFRGEKPVSVQARLEVWRTEKRDLSDEELGRPEGQFGLTKDTLAFEEPDTILDADLLRQEGFDGLCWYQRNTVSVWQVTMRQQGFKDVTDKFHDPLIHRTFGGLIFGRSRDGITQVSFKKNDPQTLQSAVPARTHEIFVTLHTAQTTTPEIWCNETAAIARRIIGDYKSFADENAALFVAHKKWWNDFWNRSHIRVLSSNPTLSMLPPCPVPLTLGMSSQSGTAAFVGEMAAPVVYSRALTADEIQQLASGGEIRDGREYHWDFSAEKDAKPGPLNGKLSAKAFNGSTAVRQPHDPNVDLSHALTLACWVLTDGKNGGRLIDKCVPGSASAGFLLDLHNGGRFLGRPFTLTLQQPVPANQWTHLAATFDGKTAKLYVNGKESLSDGGSSTPPHEVVTRGYAMQRYVHACAGRGNYAMQFNGNLFTVELKDGRFTPDYRRWSGAGYWTQNTRLMYWPMLASGDFDLMQAGMRFFTDQVPLMKERNRIFFDRGDSLFFNETAYFWGLPFMGGWGGFDWDKPGEAVFGTNRSVGRHWNGGLEMANMMLDYCAFTQDKTFLKETVVPLADAVIRFFEIISPERDENGKMLITKPTALETWQTCVNPMPDVAGLCCVTDRLLALPEDCSTPEQRAYWTALRKILPEIPIGEETGRDGVKRRLLLPGMKYDGKSNIEVPELYAVFPFQIYGVRRGELEAAINAFEQRRDKHYRGWGQDEIFAAHLGLADDAAMGLSKRFGTWAKGFRFPAMWGPNFDWIPDQDHGGSGMIALQAMLLQSVGDKLLLLPAWPMEWDVDFKLHAPQNTVVEGRVENGKLVKLQVTPQEREKDVILPGY